MSNNEPDYENLAFPPRHDETAYELQLKVNKLEKQLKIAVEALESLRTEKTVIDKATGDAYYIWDYALKQIKELDK